MAKGRFGNEYPNFQGPGKKGVSLSGMRCDEFLDRINRIDRIKKVAGEQ